MINFYFRTLLGEEIPVIITTRRGLRGITLRPRVNPNREIRVSKPFLVSDKSVLKFLEEKRKWLENIFEKSPQKKDVNYDDVIEFLGLRVQIKYDEKKYSSRLVGSENPENPWVLWVGGGSDMLQRRVRDFIKSEFLKSAKQIIKSAPKEFWPTKLSIKDTSSRWGSCTSAGAVSLSWRLAFAPPYVMRYVIIHELAHLKHMDHSVHFWACVSALYGDGVGRAKLWLSKNGQTLHQYF